MGVKPGGGHPWANTQSGGRPSPATAAGSRHHAPHPPPTTVGQPQWYGAGSTGGWRLARVSGSPCGPAHPRACVSPLAPAHAFRVFCTGASWVGGSSFWTWGLPKPPRCPVGPTGAGRRWSDGETAPGRRKGPAPAVTVLTAPG